ncbi:exodeoxyribonuclease VII small subunit [uncultured Parolsenella sp.]|uniref:exodeoxyribonuclease VII small subunit n=1 Tax=uncultured Parolsenella sp. TaxID=2083008 RepID=UPI0027D9889A|nr:exodeoxyribonuclease VII small subunit [uncultured Parolsenella sp.]
MAFEQDNRPIEELSFKEASVELEQVVRSLESGDLELEDALERYARGVELLKSLRGRLAKAEQKVQVLLDASDPTAAPDTTAAPSTVFINENNDK